MQRINYFTNPNFTGPFANVHSYGGANAAYNAGTKQLNIYGDNGGYGFNLTVPKNAALVFACFLWTKHDKNPDPLRVYSLESSGNEPIASATISQDANNLLLRFNSTGSGRIRVEFYPNGNSVNIAKPILELADTYDKAVGGASGLLHRGHDATRLRRSVGTVMSDDGHEYHQQSDRHNHSVRKRVDANNQSPEKARYDIFCQRLSARQRRLDHSEQPLETRQLRSTCRLQANSQRIELDVHKVHSRVRQSDRHSDEYALLHVRRVSGEQDSARQHRIFRRGYDAARLTLLGVVA